VVALPSGRETGVHSIVTYDGEVPMASSSMSVTLRLQDEIDLSRGDMLVARHDLPQVSRRFRARVVWLHSTRLELNRTYLVKQTTRQTKIKPVRILHRVNVNTLAEESNERLEMNEIACLEFEAHAPLFFDAYSRNRTTGSFILIDLATNATVGAGMIEGESSANQNTEIVEGVVARRESEISVSEKERFTRHGHFPAVVFLENKETLAERLERQLFHLGFEVLHLAQLPQGEATARALRVARAAGLVVLYSGSLSPEMRPSIALVFDNRTFDLNTAPELIRSEEQAARHLVALAESQWRINPRKIQGEVN